MTSEVLKYPVNCDKETRRALPCQLGGDGDLGAGPGCTTVPRGAGCTQGEPVLGAPRALGAGCSLCEPVDRCSGVSRKGTKGSWLRRECGPSGWGLGRASQQGPGQVQGWEVGT